MLKLLYFFVSAIATLCSAFSSWWTKRNKGEMTGGGELKYCRKGLSQNPSHLAHNHTMKFEVYIHLSCIWDVQPIKVFVMRTWPEMRTEKQSNYWAKEKRNAQSKTTKLWCFLSPHNNKKSPLFPCSDRAPSFESFDMLKDVDMKWHVYKPLHLSNKMEISLSTFSLSSCCWLERADTDTDLLRSTSLFNIR